MQITVVSVTFLLGLALIVVAILGGGIEIKEVKIPTLPIVPRTMSFAAGCALVVLCFWFPQVFTQFSSSALTNSSSSPPVTNPSSSPLVTNSPKDPPYLGSAIQNHLIAVTDVKVILRHLGKYSGSIDDEPSSTYFQAVGDFQFSQNIKADGLVGPDTYSKLRDAWPDYFTSNK